MNDARGYITSGQFRDERVPQHIQNLVIRNYCNNMNLSFVLSRAEYSFAQPFYSQLWSAIREGYTNIVLYSLKQLPVSQDEREMIYLECQEIITLHFACETEVLSESNVAKIEEILLFMMLASNLFKILNTCCQTYYEPI